MQTKTLLFKRLIIRCSRIYEQASSYRKYIVQCSLEYTIRGDVIVVAVATDVIVLKGCRFSVRADTTYVVSLVEPVVAHVVTYNMAYVVEYFVLTFVMVFVSILVISSCKEPCNTLCNMCCNNSLVVYLLLWKDVYGISKKYT